MRFLTISFVFLKKVSLNVRGEIIFSFKATVNDKLSYCYVEISQQLNSPLTGITPQKRDFFTKAFFLPPVLLIER